MQRTALRAAAERQAKCDRQVVGEVQFQLTLHHPRDNEVMVMY
jgi:hypothetical protein